jgi:ABC-2 type transport system permease protein
MNTAAAIVVYFLLPTAFGLLFSMVESLTGVASWIDISTSQAPLSTTRSPASPGSNCS